MHCELLIPGLLTPLEGAAPPRVPALEVLLSRGRASEAEATTMEEWLREAFDLEHLAAGALTVLGDGGEAGESEWARADPVHLRLLRDRAVIVPGEAFPIAQAEATELVASLNRHFSGRLEIQARTAARWVARLSGPMQLPATPAMGFAGREARPARGDALLTEIQMVLHEHPVNEVREARGEPAVNSVWLWGAGAAPRTASARWRSALAEDPLARGLARVAQVRMQAPMPAMGWLESAPEEGRHLVVLDTLRAAAVLGDATAFAQRLEALEAQWFAPLAAALSAGRIGMVSVHVPDAVHALSVETIRGDLRRFWRRPRPLSYWMR